MHHGMVRHKLFRKLRQRIKVNAKKRGQSPFFHVRFGRLNDIDEDKQTDPHHVNKVPVPTGRFKSKTIVFREVSLHGSEQLDEQHERTQGYMKSVKARQNKEC
jgi:DNA helicase TIP49 (TBP-interacting protein)